MGCNHNKSAPIQIKWSDVFSYLLTTSYVASDAVSVEFAKRVSVIPYYSAGAGETSNTCQFTIEINPLNATEDPAGAYWSQIGNFTNSTGTWTEEKASYIVAQGTASVYTAGTPLGLTNLNTSQIRIKVKENGVASNAGSVRFYIIKSDIA